jgi:hypothetical protein
VSQDDSSRNVSTSGTTSGPYQPAVSSSAVDVETGLAAALLRAAEAGRFDVVAQLAHELEARRLAGAGDVIRVVMDNLSTHKPAALYEHLDAAEARRRAHGDTKERPAEHEPTRGPLSDPERICRLVRAWPCNQATP